MKLMRSPPPNRMRGFTLLESIIVIVVLGLAAVGIGAIQSNVFRNQATLKDYQVGTRLMLECAEHLLAVRRFAQDGYNLLPVSGTAVCQNMTALTGYSVPTVTPAAYTGAACPSIANSCVTLSITQNGMTPVTLLMVEY